MAHFQLLAAYTKLLNTRIAHHGRVDVNIMQLSEAERPKSYNEHLGRFVGWFVLTDDHPGLMLLARKKIGEDITHAFLIYSNTNYREFPSTELSELKRKLPSEPKLAVVNIESQTPPFCDYSILLESVQYIISRNVFDEEPPLYIKLTGPGLFVAPRELRGNITRCDPNMTSEAKEVHHRIIAGKLLFVDLDDSGSIPATFDIIRMRYNGHYIFGISYIYEQSMLLLLPHIEQFPREDHFVELEERLFNRFPGRFKKFYSVRPRFLATCNGAEMLKICIILTRIPLLYVEASDVVTAMEDLDILSIGSIQNIAQNSRLSPRKSANNPPYRGSKPTIELELSSGNKRAKVLSVHNRSSSQAESLCSQQVIRRDLKEYRAWMAVADDISALHPSVHDAKPIHLPVGTILNSYSWFISQLKYVLRYWQPFTSVKLLEPIAVSRMKQSQIESKDARFVILPVDLYADQRAVGLLIFDKENKLWTWMHNSNSSQVAAAQMDYVKTKILVHFPNCTNWDGHIMILSSSYHHKKFAFVHLFMGLYYIARLFRYAVQLPQKVIYNERDLRVFAYKYCLAVQLNNQVYNIDNKLLTEDGNLKPGAYYSLPSPIQYERSVVPSDICGFCKKRGYNNLGRHMSMSHGGQAKIANVTRIVQYGYSVKE